MQKILQNKTVYLLSFLICVVIVFLLSKNFIAKPSVDLRKANSEKSNDLAVFSFSSENVSVAKGEDFTINVMIDPKTHPVSNADLVFHYDNKKMKISGIVQSEDFKQVLMSDIAKEGIVSYSSSVDFGKNINSKTLYAKLNFQALEKTEKVEIEIDREKSGIYADDNPGVNIAEFSSNGIIYIDNK